MPALRGGRLQLGDRAVVVDRDHASMSTTRRLRLVALPLALAALAAGCAAGPVGTSLPAAAVHARGGSALAAVSRLTVKGRAPKTGYSRDQFGDGWASVDGCDTRDRISRATCARRASAARRALRARAGASTIRTPRRPIVFVRGGASEVDIDHVVALGDAWQKGACRWPHRERVAFANDPLNLLAVDAAANRQKGDGDTATWLPANKSFRCAYVARQVSVKLKYALWVTAAERDAMRRVLARCPTQRVT